MSEKNTVSVLIYGQEYTLSGDMPREYIMKLADKVDAKMRELSIGKGQSLSKTAVLAAMLIADELYKSEGEKVAIIERYEERLDEQRHLLDQAQEISPETQKRIDDLEEKCRDIESSFFDLQMENIRLKNEIENYKHNMANNSNSFGNYNDNF